MAVWLTIELQGGDKLSRSLEIAAREISDFEQFFDDSLTIVENSVQEAQKTSWSSTGLWKREGLSSRTQLARQRRYGYYKNAPSSPGVLRWTWKMLSSTVKTVKKKFWSLEYTDPRAKYHQFGMWVPKRPFLVLDPKTNAEITRALQKHIDDTFGIANLR